MERSALFFDIDGTIVYEDGTRRIPESAILAIQDARSRGHAAFLNTGRVYINIEKYILDIDFDGYVLGCGTQVLYHGEELFRHRLEKEVCMRAVALVRQAGGSMIYEAADLVGYDPDAPMQWEVDGLVDYFREQGRNPIPVSDPNFYFDKFYGWVPKGDKVEPFRKGLAEHFDLIDRGETEKMFTYEIVPKGYSKATGMKVVLEKLGIPWERSYAFGDGPNDIPMLTYAAHSAAMGGCDHKTGASVSYITDTIDRDGLAKALMHYGLAEIEIE